MKSSKSRDRLLVQLNMGKGRLQHDRAFEEAAAANGNLAVAIGDLPAPLKPTAIDIFELSAERSWRNCRFVLEGSRVAAVVVRLDSYGDVRFDRKSER
jgi:hypothetical protein